MFDDQLQCAVQCRNDRTVSFIFEVSSFFNVNMLTCKSECVSKNCILLKKWVNSSVHIIDYTLLSRLCVLLRSVLWQNSFVHSWALQSYRSSSLMFNWACLQKSCFALKSLMNWSVASWTCTFILQTTCTPLLACLIPTSTDFGLFWPAYI